MRRTKLDEVFDLEDDELLELDDESTEAACDAALDIYQAVQNEVYNMKGHQSWKNELLDHHDYKDEQILSVC